MNELEVLAAQVGYRVQDCLQIEGVWTVILDDEDGEITSTGATPQEAIERMTERLVAVLNRVGH
jgi:predicted RNase H-like HicB family nuclease